MANTINDLYLKYVDGIGSTLESDRYFQYLFMKIWIEIQMPPSSE